MELIEIIQQKVDMLLDSAEHFWGRGTVKRYFEPGIPRENYYEEEIEQWDEEGNLYLGTKKVYDDNSYNFLEDNNIYNCDDITKEILENLYEEIGFLISDGKIFGFTEIREMLITKIEMICKGEIEFLDISYIGEGLGELIQKAKIYNLNIKYVKVFGKQYYITKNGIV